MIRAFLADVALARRQLGAYETIQAERAQELQQWFQQLSRVPGMRHTWLLSGLRVEMGPKWFFNWVLPLLPSSRVYPRAHCSSR